MLAAWTESGRELRGLHRSVGAERMERCVACVREWEEMG